MAVEADYKVIEDRDGVVYVVDLDRGNRSVTNDAEAVVDKVTKTHPGRKIVYRDTEKKWGELDHDGSKFRGFKRWDGWEPTWPY